MKYAKILFGLNINKNLPKKYNVIVEEKNERHINIQECKLFLSNKK